MIMVAVILISFIVALSLALYISGSISRPMQKFAALAALLATGDIEVDKVIEEKDKQLKRRKDEVGVLAGAFNSIIASTVKQADEMRMIAGGDLTVSVTVRSEEDFIGKALSELVEKFHDLVVSIVSAANQVNSGAKLVSDSSTVARSGSRRAGQHRGGAYRIARGNHDADRAERAERQDDDELARGIRKGCGSREHPDDGNAPGHG